MPSTEIMATLRVRMSNADTHYGGNLVDGARILGLFGDLATEILIRNDGDEGLFRAYDSVEFLAPVKAGDFIRVEARLISHGRTSRQISFEAFKEIESHPEAGATAAATLAEPLLVARARGTVVVPQDRQRLPPASDRARPDQEGATR